MKLLIALALPVAACVSGAFLFHRAADPTQATCQLTLELVDAESGESLPGIVQLRAADGALVDIVELVNRGQGIEQRGPIHQWWVLPRAAIVKVPAVRVTLHALAGLESELATQEIDLTGRAEAKLKIPLARFYRARPNGRLAGNTHLHLMKLSKGAADRYLREVPLADGLDIVFVSYLERAQADLEYTSNHYTRDDLERLSHGHVHFGHGQEHRHNFGSHGEGYGHILLLDIPYIIRPVSIGPGITTAGPDAPPLQQGIDKARSLGGKVIWAHNLYGFEDIPNWITGRVHANNIFDGSHRGSYEDTYYRYLNIGLHVPFSTGTDWFIYDFSRVYVASDKAITPTEWLDRLAAGRTFITNGPLLELTLDGHPVGDTVDLASPKPLQLRGRCLGRSDFKQLEVVHNGRVVATAASRAAGGHFVAEIEQSLMFDEPAWLALRTPPPPLPERAPESTAAPTNEFGGKLFAHTSPVYVKVAGRGVFDAETARGLITEMKSDWEAIVKQAVFDDEHQREHVQAVYDEAIARLEQRLAEAAP